MDPGTDRAALQAATIGALARVWIAFETSLAGVPLIDKLNRGKLRRDDYLRLLVNLRQQVIEGGRWIARAASSFDARFAELRSRFIRHAAAEHRDYLMLEADCLAAGGDVQAMRAAPKNIGSEALSGWMFHCAGQPNPVGLLGAMFVIEGLGQRLAAGWAAAIRGQLRLPEAAVTFLAYHGAGDAAHMEQFGAALALAVASDDDAAAIVKTAKVTARLYRLQLEEIDNA
ncbi:MAG: iron-containing redox enzyme family protein [Alphaproteobacteria bacterium]|nr:iron-containing redox enzyme family protein [Alphaproteobacteria bacterium]